jgi:hypothetical protein
MPSLKINRGTTYTITVNYQKDGVAATLVGATVRFTVKTAEFSAVTDDADAVIKKDITSGSSGGVATITLNPADTATLAPGSYFYDIKVKEAGGTVYKIVEGRINLDGSPTNRLT